MSVSNEIRRTLSDPKPLYALAGAGDLAASTLRDAPTLLTEAAATVTTLANRIAAEAPEQIAKVQARLAEVPNALAVDPRTVVGTLDPRTARESILGVVSGVDTQALRDKAQTIALIQVGRVLEAAGKAVETYDGLAERGKTVVERYRGAGDGEVTDVTVVVEQVIVEEPEPAEAKAQTKDEPKSASASAPSSSSNAGASRGRTSGAASSAKPQASQAKKTAAAPRKRATSPNASKSTKA